MTARRSTFGREGLSPGHEHPRARASREFPEPMWLRTCDQRDPSGSSCKAMFEGPTHLRPTTPPRDRRSRLRNKRHPRTRSHTRCRLVRAWAASVQDALGAAHAAAVVGTLDRCGPPWLNARRPAGQSRCYAYRRAGPAARLPFSCARHAPPMQRAHCRQRDRAAPSSPLSGFPSSVKTTFTGSHATQSLSR